ncbi:hypothetical protein UGMREWDR_CDS0123 [Aeromonas phage GomatiRiver_11]|nr:hypothetical protein OBDJBBDK_00114 [Aeromonas phage AhFM11]WKW84290.1 hypothetical protein UGMREWDR_CDS0123 [Aeromonas phage GomatiRiver_11]
MEFKIIVRSRAKGSIDQYISNVKASIAPPAGVNVHYLRHTDGMDIIYHADGYEPNLYAEIQRHVAYILNTVRVPTGADVMGWA